MKPCVSCNLNFRLVYGSYCKECAKARAARHYQRNKESIKARTSAYAKQHREDQRLNRYKRGGRAAETQARIAKYGPRIKREQYEARRNRRQTDELYRFKESVANSVRAVVRRMKLGMNTQPKFSKRYGCTTAELYAHLVCTALNRYGVYTDDMNYEIDHIIPMATAKTKEEAIALQHYTNLRFLTKEDNKFKSSNLILFEDN